MARPFLTAQWRDLAMINFEIAPALLEKRVPRGAELDFFEGRTFVSLVGFLFLETRLLGMPVPFHRDFEEVNLRFYVRRKGPDGWRRGVSFVKEIVPRLAIATVARAVYNEPYVALPMQHDIAPDHVEFSWRSGARRSFLRLDRSGEPAAAAAGSQEEFITEHYWGYCAQRDGGTVEYQVEHPRWRVWRATGFQFDCDVAGLYGDEFVAPLAAKPVSAFIADGSETIVRRAVRLRTAESP